MAETHHPPDTSDTFRCPLCGAEVTEREHFEIEKDMEWPNRSCLSCARTFSEARMEEGL